MEISQWSHQSKEVLWLSSCCQMPGDWRALKTDFFLMLFRYHLFDKRYYCFIERKSGDLLSHLFAGHSSHWSRNSHRGHTLGSARETVKNVNHFRFYQEVSESKLTLASSTNKSVQSCERKHTRWEQMCSCFWHFNVEKSHVISLSNWTKYFKCKY